MIKLKDLIKIIPANAYVQIGTAVYVGNAVSNIKYTAPELADCVLRKYPNYVDLNVRNMYYEDPAVGSSCYVIEVDNNENI